MPIYEFLCEHCNTLFNFLSRRINTTKIPECPKCSRPLKKIMSSFATIGRAGEPGDEELPPGFDETKMERALGELAQEAEKMNEEDPKAMAHLMRKFSDKTGLVLNENMEQALSRLEAGEDPGQIEREMGDVFEGENALPFELKQARKSAKQKVPARDETLYEM